MVSQSMFGYIEYTIVCNRVTKDIVGPCCIRPARRAARYIEGIDITGTYVAIYRKIDQVVSHCYSVCSRGLRGECIDPTFRAIVSERNCCCTAAISYLEKKHAVNHNCRGPGIATLLVLVGPT